MRKMKICIVTGSRAEWGLLYPLAKEIKKAKDMFMLQIVVAGGHLSRSFGSTYKEVQEDGFKIYGRVKMDLSKDTEESIAKSVSAGIAGFVNVFKSSKPDLIMLLGDRFEIFSAAVACTFLKIPIAHIHGGELTEGSLDDTLRHAITKMSYLHFVSTDIYRKRVVQMGEDPSRVFNVGALGVDNIKNEKLLSKYEFEVKAGFKLAKRNILVTYNPPTLGERSSAESQFKNLLKVIDTFNDIHVIFTKPSPDMYSKTIIKMMDNYVSKNRNRAKAFMSMGRLLYLSALQFMNAVVGNSSSGIIEAPSFGLPSVNIGERQEGRIRADSVIDAQGDRRSIKKAVEKALSEEFCRLCKDVKNPYGGGDSAKKIVSILKKIHPVSRKKAGGSLSMTKGVLSFSTAKRFFDISFGVKTGR